VQYFSFAVNPYFLRAAALHRIADAHETKTLGSVDSGGTSPKSLPRDIKIFPFYCSRQRTVPKHYRSLRPGSPTFLSEGHISYLITFWGPDILRNVIVSGCVTFYQSNNFFANLLFFINDIMSLQTDETALRAGFGPRAIV